MVQWKRQARSWGWINWKGLTDTRKLSNYECYNENNLPSGLEKNFTQEFCRSSVVSCTWM